MKTKQKTIKRSKLSNLSMVAGGEKNVSKVICDGTVWQRSCGFAYCVEDTPDGEGYWYCDECRRDGEEETEE